MRVTLVIGARPNFMKAAPVLHALQAREGVTATVVHTGQHYDANMSDSFLQDLGIRPDHLLGVGSSSHGRQTADVLVRFEEFLNEHPQDMVVVFGDVNSTVAATLAAVKLHVPVAHVESGLRSRDRRMPEEINRLMVDTVASLLFVTEPSGVDNLRAEGVDERRIHHVGNTMIDTLHRFRGAVSDRPLPDGLPERFGVVTLHRPSNVDDAATLTGILDAFEELAAELPLVWPVHPRTEARLKEFGQWERVAGSTAFRGLPPVGYLDFLALMSRAALILTDSGGIQEEALVLRVPVVTLRENTERPVTVEGGGNLLSGPAPDRIRACVAEMRSRDPSGFQVPELWDGRAGERVADALVKFLREGGGL